jgi:YrbI family 3-deoxy-D-manno-octulosonate 8-phosphate phosphatase
MLRIQAFKKKLKNVKLVVFDFDGVFTDNKVFVFQDGREAVACSRLDGMGISLMRKAGVDMFVLSMEENPVVAARCKKLSLPCVHNCADKKKALGEELSRRGLAWKNVLFMGNDVNDAECLMAAGCAVCPADAHPSVRKYAHYITRWPGGSGAVRELCDIFLKVNYGK